MFLGVTPTILRPSLLSAVLKPQDVFATSLYTGNSSGQKLSLPFSPDFVWIKPRNTTNQHFLFDKLRGSRNYLSSNLTDAEVLATSGFSLVSFDADGFTLGQNYNGENGSGTNEVAWPMKRAAKFFDIVTWTGDGTSNRQIPHSLGVPPGMVIAKCRTNVIDWPVYHRSIGATAALFLNLANAALTNGTLWGNTEPTATTFTVGSYSGANQSGQTYVALVIAHDPSADGIVQCGLSTSNSSGVYTIPHGWSNGAQWYITKTSDVSGNWVIQDTARSGTNWSGSDPNLFANLANAESVPNYVSQSGGVITVNDGASNTKFIWAVIRASY